MSGTEAVVVIAGTEVYNYEYVFLNQSINKHHDFEIGVDLEVIESQGMHTLDQAKSWLGESVMLNLNGVPFEGIATNVELRHKNGLQGQLVVTGYSNTIDLDSIPHMQSWLEKPLKTIVSEVAKGSICGVKVSPKYTDILEYESQYQETNFKFIQRLAKQYNEWLFYNGKELCFGKETIQSDFVKAEYGRDIYDINVGIQTKPSSQSAFSYNSFLDKLHNSKTQDSVAGLNELGTSAFNASKKIFKKPINSYVTHRVKSKGEIDDFLKRKQSSRISDAHYITGKSVCKNLKIGTILDIGAAIWDNKTYKQKSYGEYIITELKHEAKVGGSYINTFRALPADIQYLPEPDVSFPMAETQRATVVSNNDPKKKGRVQVKMNWQTDEMKTSWIRVLTPDAGSSDKVSTNRGFVFIPEVGDQVLLGFRYNDPNRPYVTGSLFSGKTASGGSDQNKVKSLATRSGCKLSLDDSQGSLLLSDQGNAQIHFDGAGTSTATANDTHNVIAGKGGESALKMDKNGDIILTGKNSLKIVIGDSTFEMLKDGTIKINGKDVKVTATASTDISASKNHIAGTTKLDGGDVFIN